MGESVRTGFIQGNPSYNHKFEFEIVHKLLEILETLPKNKFVIEEFRDSGISDPNKFIYYLLRMKEAELVKFSTTDYVSGQTTISYPIITYYGHEYLANLKNESLMEKVKGKVSELGGSVSINLVTKIVSELAMRSLFPAT